MAYRTQKESRKAPSLYKKQTQKHNVYRTHKHEELKENTQISTNKSYQFNLILLFNSKLKKTIVKA